MKQETNRRKSSETINKGSFCKGTNDDIHQKTNLTNPVFTKHFDYEKFHFHIINWTVTDQYFMS